MRSGLQWSLGGVDLAYSTISDGDARERAHREAFGRRSGCHRRLVVPRQVHGAVIVDAGAEPDRLAQADGLATGDHTIGLGVFGADCPGLCLIAPDALVVAHCGWRGVAAGIVGAAGTAMAQRTTASAADWLAFIGPGICGRHYEVDDPVLRARHWPPAAISDRSGSRAQLDLVTAIAADLRALGVAQISACAVCTAEDDRLWSYRRRGAGAVQALVAWRAG